MADYRELDLPRESYEQGRIRTTLEHGEPTSEIRVRVYGDVERTSGSSGDASVYSDHLQRLLSHEMRADSFDILESEISLRDLYEYHRMNVSEVRTRSEVSASNINSGQTESFDISYSIHGHRNYLLRPSEVFWPAWDGRRGPSLTNGFYLFHQFETGKVNSSSDPGTAAIFSGGSDTYEFTDGPYVEIQQVIMPGRSDQPALIPAYEIIEDGDIQSALSNYPMEFDNQFTWDLLLLRAFHGSDLQLEDSTFWQNVGLQSSSVDIIESDTPFWSLEQQGINRFVGYHGLSGTESSPATLPIDPVGGRLRQRINPRQFTNLKLVLDSEAPQSTPATIRAFQAIGKGIDGVTRLMNR